MKAWRKHNQKQSARVQVLERRLELEKTFVSYTTDTKEVDKLQLQIKEAQGFRLRTKHERRTQYAAEVATPSYLLLALFKRVGLWTPA